MFYPNTDYPHPCPLPEGEGTNLENQKWQLKEDGFVRLWSAYRYLFIQCLFHLGCPYLIMVSPLILL